MKYFKHLTLTQRIQLETLLKTKISIKEISKIIGVHISTIYREIKRGTYEHLNSQTYIYENRYSSTLADEKYRQNLKDKGAELKIGNDYKLAEYIEKRIIKDRLSPLAVIGEIKIKNLRLCGKH